MSITGFTIFGYTIPQIKKTVVAFVTPGVVALGVALTTGSPGDSAVTGGEWIGVGVAMFGTSILVFNVKNAPVSEVTPAS